MGSLELISVSALMNTWQNWPAPSAIEQFPLIGGGMRLTVVPGFCAVTRTMSATGVARAWVLATTRSLPQVLAGKSWSSRWSAQQGIGVWLETTWASWPTNTPAGGLVTTRVPVRSP